MMHDLLFHTLLLLGILGLSVSLLWVWRQRPRGDPSRHHARHEACTREPAVSWSPPSAVLRHL